MTSRRLSLLAACAGVVSFASAASAQIVINEFQYDDGGTDNVEFVELYNPTAAPVDISGWSLGGRDNTGNNIITTIPGATSIAAGGYYVIGNTGVQNVNQVVAGGFLENDQETIELRSGVFASAAIVDAVSYESNKGFTALPADVLAQTGPGFFGNTQGTDLGVSPNLLQSSSVGRWVNGSDTNNNGRDFGMRIATPGANNNPLGLVTAYNAPNVESAAVGSNVANFGYSFVQPRVIDPTIVDGNNPNSFAPLPGLTKAIVAWDPSGGGNGVTSFETFGTAQSSFSLKVYFDTNNIPLNTNASAVTFRGSEFTFFGIGSTDALANLTDISGAVGDAPGTPPAADNDAGFTGIFWLYEKVGESTLGGGDVVENLYLVDANDGGDSTTGGNTPLDWTILYTIDMTSLSSTWYDLGISIDAAGNGVGTFNGQSYVFTTTAGLKGAFSVAYRENTQDGTDGTPSYNRPATFVNAAIPEPASLSLIAMGAVGLLRRKRR